MNYLPLSPKGWVGVKSTSSVGIVRVTTMMTKMNTRTKTMMMMMMMKNITQAKEKATIQV